jgi:ribokinase
VSVSFDSRMRLSRSDPRAGDSVGAVSAGVVVLGSANVDVVLAVERIPAPGETVIASGQARHPGGKGLNQAVAASRAGATTGFVSAVGNDDGGAFLIETMAQSGLDVAMVRRVNEPTGTALITVDADGENAIVVVPAANATMIRLGADEAAAIRRADVLVMQLEIPVSIVVAAARAAREAGTRVVLNAAPAQQLDAALLETIDILVVNEQEARVVAGADEADGLDDLGRTLAGRVPIVVVTLGDRGARWFGAEGEGSAPAPKAEVVDTTGAGDTFTGVLAAGLAEGLGWATAVQRAVVAGAIAVESAGAVPSIPTRAQIEGRSRRAVR